MKKESIFKRVYDFYSKDLTSEEFERLIMKETPTRYKYLMRNMEKPLPPKNKIEEVFGFIKNFAEAFLKKLSPAIRLLYTIGLFLFAFSMLKEDWNLAVTSFLLINLLMIFEIADKLTARDELEVARDVQTGLIPVEAPEDADFELASYYETAKEVGGDFIDFISKPDNSYLISIGDISGKGMSAALQMVQVRLLFRFISDTQCDPNCDPKKILVQLNGNLFRHLKNSLYFSMTLAKVRDKKLKICRAGHTQVLYYNSSDHTCEEIQQKGMALGLNNTELFEKSIQEIELNTNQNDIILFYSDGLSEAMNAYKREFGIERIKELILHNSNKSALEIKNAILDEVSKFRGYAEVHDDITFILMKSK
ncbi:MAG TPA: SpoIIE family protein phosphatase [Ignavibacteria bacterium]|nr:SpoIIE family protein phosphatase [Ignavibacteria bacterium]